MYDSITAADCPADGDLYAGYLNGRWQSYEPLVQLHPGKRVVSISVFPSDVRGDVLDVETGDATPAQAPAWLAARRNQGAWPSLYCNPSNRQAVEDAVAAAGLVQPPYWVAHYTHVSHMEPGAVATQWDDPGPYDVSLVADYWPGVDGPPPSQGAVTLTPAAQVRAWIIEYWGREPSVAEQYGGEVYLAQHGDDLTIAFLYDHAEAQAFRGRRGW